MRFTKIGRLEWKSTTEKGTFFINKSESPNLGIIKYEVQVDFNDGGSKMLGYDLPYLRDAKAVAKAF